MADPIRSLPRTHFANVQITQNEQGPQSVYPANLGIQVRNASGSPITAGSLVSISGWYATGSIPAISLADADVAGATAMYVATADIADATTGVVCRAGTLGSLNTNAGNVGDPVYLSTTAGSWTLTAPSTVTSRVQVVGRITVKSTTVGQIAFDLESHPPLKAIGQNEVVANALGSGQLTADICDFVQYHNLSFESGEQTTAKFFLPYAATITAMYSSVTKALSNTDAGTIDIINSAGVTKGTHTIPLSSTLTTECTTAITSFTVADASFYRLTWAKATAGGKVQVQVTGIKTG